MSADILTTMRKITTQKSKTFHSGVLMTANDVLRNRFVTNVSSPENPRFLDLSVTERREGGYLPPSCNR